MRTLSYFEVHFCFTEPGGNVVQGFDIHFVWKFPECRPGVLDGEQMLLRAEASVYDEVNWEPAGFLARFGKQQRWFWLGANQNRNRYRVRATGSGGNWYWEVVRFAWNDVPHVLNWLRRQKSFSKSEWCGEFMAVWQSRRSLDEAALRAFARAEMRRYLKAEAARCGFGKGVGSVAALIGQQARGGGAVYRAVCRKARTLLTTEAPRHGDKI